MRNGPKSARLVTAAAEARSEREMAEERAAMELEEDHTSPFSDDEDGPYMMLIPPPIRSQVKCLCFC